MGKVISSIKNGLFGSVFIAILLHMLPSITIAQDYPIKPLRLVVPYPPGGAVDLTARLLSQRLAQALGQTIVIDNRPGAAGHLGAEQVSKASADGYTLLYTVGAELAMRQSLPGSIDLLRDLTPIASVAASVSCIVARPNLPLGSMQELLELARRNPGKLSFGSAGIGSTHHLTGELLREMGVSLMHVPYKGVAPAMTALLSGETDLAITNLAMAMPQLRQGKLKLLAITQSNRFEGAPGVPPVTEALTGFNMPVAWYGFFAPPGLNAVISAKLAGEIGRTVSSAEVRNRLTDASMSPLFTSGEGMINLIRDTAASYARIVRVAGIRLDG